MTGATRRLRVWLESSLGNRMAWSAGTLALGVSTVLMIIAFGSIGVLLVRQMDIVVRAQADADASRGAGALGAAIGRVRELARHSMVINGLVDSSGRQSYLVPFIEQDEFHARLGGVLAVCDPAGEVIASAGRLPWQQACHAIGAGARRQTPGLTELAVVREAGEIFLDLVEPIYMVATDSVEGVVRGRVSARRILEQSGLWNNATLLGIELGGQRQNTGSGDDGGPLLRIESSARVAMAGNAPVLMPRFFYGVSIAPLYKPALLIMLTFVITLLLLVLMVAYLARRQAARLATPLIRLKEATARAAQGEPVELEPALIRRDEIGTLAIAVKSMADTLQGQGEALESEVRRRTAELVDAKEATERINRELQTFAYSVAHDLKAPLRGIDGYSGLLLSEYADRLDDEGRRYLVNVRTATVNMGQLIDDLLSYSRLEQREFASSQFSLTALVESIVDQCRDEIAESAVSVSAELPGQPMISCDREGLAIVLRNLLGNALKFTRGRPAPRVEVRACESPNNWILQVSDNGVGFDMRYHERIFAIFQRLHRSEEYPGTGVGLAIVRKAVERMGGRVWAESAPGEGETFFVELPK